ncbi:uncharacterized protein EDB93DRAFT_1077341 [Suillus bovinus]|uniref:uncharacterized protein n=1 Tax=Suillus bovinus TaxID=48563 RepID=UPI001B880139|nr:uncharacterized protein EDB93DRAFT_1077341 [Suillus bovinus]KAG2158223.1 hypothetical protein EDB93DRAFT_1077341 [Suillus bovinus]
MWKRSPSPEESWSDAEGGNENGEWPIKGVVGEEVDPDGTSRYEVRWGNWSRKDGTNTTWQTDITDRSDLINTWKKHQDNKRNALAQDGLDIEVSWPDDAVHKRFTFLRAQAYEEKKRKGLDKPSAAHWDQEIERVRRHIDELDAEDGNAASRLRVHRSTPRSTPSYDARLSSVKRTRVPTPPNPPSRRGASARKRSPSIGDDAFRSLMFNLSTSTVESPRAISKAATERYKNVITNHSVKSAREAGAADLRISNEIVDGDVGQHLHRFKYMERSYHFDNDGLQSIFNVDPGAFLACECTSCQKASQCDCQSESEVTNGRGYKLYAYSGVSITFCSGMYWQLVQGLFTSCIPRGVEVIECNKYCRCGPMCGNRVAQKPRDIPIEIFKTKQCGWGARCPIGLPKGKVMGIYTGRREDVDNLPPEHIGYVFDLDGTEVRGQHNEGDKFSVDSYDYGNWTRFVNHSCSPSMKVYSVVFDTIREVHMPYVAFVTARDILAGEELTIDYEPSALEDMAEGTGKQKRKMSPTALLCKCSSKQCRGWIKQ